MRENTFAATGELFREVYKSSALRQLKVRATALRILIPATTSLASAIEAA
jgi:hypothetical protein